MDESSMDALAISVPIHTTTPAMMAAPNQSLAIHRRWG
jgi:hypothetical protein